MDRIAGLAEALQDWLKQCRAASAAEVRTELVAAGIADPKLRPGAYVEAPCGAVAMAFPQGDMGNDWTLFQTKLASARRVASTLIWSAALAQAVGDEAGDILAAQLIARPVTDQVLRNALSWNAGETKGAPPLDPMEAGIVRGLTWSAIRARDHANTAWMKTVVAQHGWPTIAMVGAQASGNAWMLVQHADDDPVFQLRILRLMEPLAMREEELRAAPRPRDAPDDRPATLRHAMELREPFPLEDRTRIDAWRATVDLGTLAANGAQIAKEYGSCPPASH